MFSLTIKFVTASPGDFGTSCKQTHAMDTWIVKMVRMSHSAAIDHSFAMTAE